MNDVGAVMWKEWRELRAQSSELGRIATRIVAGFLLVFTAVVAAFAGEYILTTPILLIASYAPMLSMLGNTCDSFAGERERHTLETLLASRIRSEALLVGKIATQVLYGCAMAAVIVGVFMLGANARDPMHPVLPPLPLGLALVLLTPLVGLFLATAGALVSLRSPTVKHAQTRMAFVIIAGFAGSGLFSRLAQSHGMLAAVIGGSLVLFAADVALFLLAWMRFRRDNLLAV